MAYGVSTVHAVKSSRSRRLYKQYGKFTGLERECCDTGAEQYSIVVPQ